MQAKFEAAGSLSGIVGLASAQLNERERDYLEVATAAKMIDLRVYRKFRFTAGDRSYVARALRKHHRLLTRPEKLAIVRKVAYQVRPKFGLKSLALRLRNGSTAPPYDD